MCLLAARSHIFFKRSWRFWLIPQKVPDQASHKCARPCSTAASAHRNPLPITSMTAAVSAVHSWDGLSSLQNSNTVTCWHTSSIYIWINMREIQIHEWNSGGRNQQADFALLPLFLLHSLAHPLAHPYRFPHFSWLVWKATSLQAFIFTAVPQSPFSPSSFLPLLLSPIVLSISRPAVSLILLFPLSDGPRFPSLPPTLSLLSSAELNGD